MIMLRHCSCTFSNHCESSKISSLQANVASMNEFLFMTFCRLAPMVTEKQSPHRNAKADSLDLSDSEDDLPTHYKVCTFTIYL
jgi:hypothetical protein